MKFIKLTRVLNPYEVRIGYHGTTYIPSPYAPIGQMYSLSSTSGSASSGTTGFLQGLGSLVGLGGSSSSSGLAAQQQSQLSQQQQSLAAQGQMQQQLTSMGQAGQVLTYSGTSPTYVTLPNPPSETQDVYIPFDAINYMIAVKDLNYSTSLFLINNDEPFSIKESPEQIMKMMHDQEFNAKMDDILK